ncbi:MAG: metallophosphoesterase [Sphingomonas sp.]
MASPVIARTQAFVLMAPDGGAVARAITDGGACPALHIDGHAKPMAQRFAPATLPPRPSASGSAESHPSAFPVRVCEAALPKGTRHATVADHRLPLPPAIVKRVVLIGDTGCRLKASSGAYQACNDPRHWPFERVARAAAAAKPDLVLHVGDYHYRENACPDGNAGCAGSPWGYGWDAWDADFFTPAARLLAAAPWVVDRGNHEECARAGQGWWILLDPHPLLAGRDCVAAANDATGDRAPPYAVELGGRARLIVYDFAKIGEKAITDPATLAAYRADAAAGLAMARAGDTNFMTDHYPFGAITETGKKGLRVGYPSVAGAFDAATPLPPVPHVAAVLSGHIHLLQVAAVKGYPAQIITGFSGTEEDEPPAPGTAAQAPALPDGLTLADLETRYGVFGFATLDRAAHGAWRFTARDWDGKPLLTRLIRRR